ncbi:flagellar basal body rod protein FlgC [Gluconobacter thailandicus F149-1 = NBRC 100600]|uniref:Flagellar basal-body rod protein FlgC n=1 Tax=Gluconobacter thailandicus NBRC 3257 TaxID=1381097 RepID=A0ABQ0IXA5_GLUTH|nr:flagellar basal body rod protein FlgC [Gluconobacter thailandicus]KXV54427.1 flagellar biosynthesis protein FlgC [Gluconobacter thailandicus]GAC89405.1 flagellar basal body rod protein FlgC [Gluconobacter thailandicus NBRC 3255]GAD26846.1 flagellar basal body rod protein FlgC [Gluconobacter thailandicus NBRC 3257]GAN93809.1 flagellar basal body rod protein FlgC [Gluconobacter thailandicus F149-1 = NBRC 100600]GBR61180.1 flagellar basal body rod protein FlgC [Gluconobacter thailandicus F149-
MNLSNTIGISASGMDAQAQRLRIVAENLANQDTTGSTPGADPYRRKTITFAEHVDDDTGASTVDVHDIGQDMSDFQTKYDPSHPAADAQGYVKISNVDSMVEMMDMREAERSYEANLNTMQSSRTMLSRTLDLLK